MSSTPTGTFWPSMRSISAAMASASGTPRVRMPARSRWERSRLRSTISPAIRRMIRAICLASRIVVFGVRFLAMWEESPAGPRHGTSVARVLPVGARLRIVRSSEVRAPSGGKDQPRQEWERMDLFHAGVAEAERFFMGESKVQRALDKIVRLLEEDGIPYAVIGAMALNAYGYLRVTVDVDLLLTREGLEEFKKKHLGLGYLEKFPGSKGLRDTEHGVTVDAVLAGEYPGDGLTKPVVFPDPATAAVKEGDRALLPLPLLQELKIASVITAPHRLKDVADVS